MVAVIADDVRANAAETWTWVAIALAVTAVFAPPLAAAALAVAAALAFGWADPSLTFDSQWVAIALALVAWPVFFYLRTQVLNQDGTMLTPKIERDVPLLGAHFTHDEVLELFVHSRIWDYTHRWRNWSVVFSYQVVSCTAGSLFVYGVLRLARRLVNNHRWLFLVGALSGGYMQLFFGDVENYTITAAIVVLYVLAAVRFLMRDGSLLAALASLALAICFHLEAGWLLPSAVYLLIVSHERTGVWTDPVRGTVAGAAMIAAVFVYFHFNGLPLVRFFSSHAGHAFRANGVFAFGMPASYYVDQLKLLILLCPAIAMLVPFAAWSVRPTDQTTAFLGVATICMLVFQAIWKAQLGVFDDWNLYAIGGVITSVLIWRYAATAASTPARKMTAAALAAVGCVHTYGWILANHAGHP
jgi:hypothetical protein